MMNHILHIDHELKIIRYTHYGIIKDEDIENVWKELLTIPEFTSKKYDLLSDYRKGEIIIPVKNLSNIIQFMRNIEPIVKGKKQAIVVQDPNSTAAAMLFEGKIYLEVGFLVKVFCTEKAALKWLKN